MKRPELMITNGELAGRRFSVKEGGLRLGRSSSNDIHVADEQLSRNHCLFEVTGEEGIRLTDLASANGTYLNGRALGGDPAELKVGDLIEVGTTVIRVVGEAESDAPGSVDLGLGPQTSAPEGGKRRSPLAGVLWLVAVVLAAAAIYVVLVAPPAETEEVKAAKPSETPVLEEMSYERVEADSNGIFRYAMSLSAEGVLTADGDGHDGGDDVGYQEREMLGEREQECVE